MNVFLLSQNFELYTGGYYHQDWVNSIVTHSRCDVYGPGYSDYDLADDLTQAMAKFGKHVNCYDVIIASSSWDLPGQKQGDGKVNIHPNIDLSGIEGPKKVYFLNKEYINLDAKLDYAVRNKFDLVVTVFGPERYSSWEERTGIKFIQLPFGVDLSRIQACSQNKYDFGFSGALHSSYIDERFMMKSQLFSDKRSIVQHIAHFLGVKIFPSKNWQFCKNNRYIPSNIGLPRLLSLGNPLNARARSYRIYWAERHPVAKHFNLSDLLPFGDDYFKLLASSRTFLCTLSADGILGPRFFELMASKTLIICPRGEYEKVLEDQVNCMMYDDPAEIFDILDRVTAEPASIDKIVETAYELALDNTYDARIRQLFATLSS